MKRKYTEKQIEKYFMKHKKRWMDDDKSKKCQKTFDKLFYIFPTIVVLLSVGNIWIQNFTVSSMLYFFVVAINGFNIYNLIIKGKISQMKCDITMIDYQNMQIAHAKKESPKRFIDLLKEKINKKDKIKAIIG